MDANLRERCLAHAFSSKTLPLLTESLDALARLLQSQGVSPKAYMTSAKGADWLKNAGSISHLIASGALDATQLEAVFAEIDDPKIAPDHVIDRFLLPYLLLLAARPKLAGDPPAWLVDALAAMIAVDADDALLDLAAADDRLDGDRGCLTLPWLARKTLVARWLSRQVSPPVLWRVVSGAVAWRDGIPAPVLEEAHTIHGGVSARSDSTTHEEDDVFSLMDAFHALTSVRTRLRKLPVTQAVVPAGGALRWDLRTGQLRALGDAMSVTQAATAGFLAPPLHALPLPLPLGAALRAEGWQALDLRLDDADEADELLDSLLDLALDPLPPQTIDGIGFCILPAVDP